MLDRRSLWDTQYFDLCNADVNGTGRFADRGSHEFRPDWIANIFAKDDVDRGEVIFAQRPASHFPDGGELFRTTSAPECNTNTGLIEEPANRQMNHALAKMLASVCIQFGRCVQILGEVRLLKFGISSLAHVVFGKVAICVHCAA